MSDRLVAATVSNTSLLHYSIGTLKRASTTEPDKLRRGLLLLGNFWRLEFFGPTVPYRENLLTALSRPSLAKSPWRVWKA